MKYLPIVAALMAVTGGLAALALWILRQAQAKQRSGLRWMSGLLGCWLGVMAGAAFGARAAYVQHFKAAPGFWVVFVPAAVLAFAAAVALGWRLSRLPSLADSDRESERASEPAAPPPPPPSAPPIPPTPVPAPPPAEHLPEVVSFKFACPHCGQRLGVTTADIGSSAECPSCQAALIIPAPSEVDASA